ncbi:hypothetical protein KAW80_04585 [Candidatus Babeliales bacterium]|nr:hypothetical protein [Candidatus Babeliales bacterium]
MTNRCFLIITIFYTINTLLVAKDVVTPPPLPNLSPRISPIYRTTSSIEETEAKNIFSDTHSSVAILLDTYNENPRSNSEPLTLQFAMAIDQKVPIIISYNLFNNFFYRKERYRNKVEQNKRKSLKEKFEEQKELLELLRKSPLKAVEKKGYTKLTAEKKAQQENITVTEFCWRQFNEELLIPIWSALYDFIPFNTEDWDVFDCTRGGLILLFPKDLNIEPDAYGFNLTNLEKIPPSRILENAFNSNKRHPNPWEIAALIDLLKENKRSWNIYLSGHGTWKKTPIQDIMISGMTIKNFETLLSSNINIGFLYYNTCYGGGYNANRILNFIKSLRESEDTVLRKVLPPFILATGALTDASTTVHVNLSMIQMQKNVLTFIPPKNFIKFFSKLIKFFNKKATFRTDPFKELLQPITQANLMLEKDPRFTAYNMPSYLLPIPGLQRFNPANINNQVLIINFVKQKVHELEKRPIVTNGQKALLLFLEKILVPVNIEKTCPLFISMTNKKAHIFQEINAMNQSIEEFLKEAFGSLKEKFSLRFHIKKLACNGFIFGEKNKQSDFEDVIIEKSEDEPFKANFSYINSFRNREPYSVKFDKPSIIFFDIKDKLVNAIKEKNEDLTRRLITHINPNMEVKYNGTEGSLLHLAVNYSTPNVLKILLDSGTYIFVENPLGNSPLEEVILKEFSYDSEEKPLSKNSEEFIQLLITTSNFRVREVLDRLNKIETTTKNKDKVAEIRNLIKQLKTKKR